MKERPILFTGPMVRAILEGRKTVTRRIAKPVKHPDLGNIYAPGALVLEHEPQHVVDRACPYGQPGDRLWVRETWHVGKPHDKTAPADILAPLLAEGRGITVLYTAGGWQSVGPAGREEPIYPDDQPLPDWAGKGRPSIHMPRWACRILLEITAVRVERLQDISEVQARAEGITDGGCSNCGNHEPCGCECPAPSAVDSFVHLWRSTGGNWESNPWVWVVEFKRVTP
ncbi:hypothetical protein [Pseudomonas sp. 17023671]|uniref:hypothetical protein n=1 Tax=Pseudomonas sp. 17023671 TaxID=2952237 RepID=UPI0021571B3D|nr:hypothetical protein [Pseudomonas sp. 17023671]